jgi:4-amino-4-deoxy-L-arabinose transferase-like glycosyltransferase
MEPGTLAPMDRPVVWNEPPLRGAATLATPQEGSAAWTTAMLLLGAVVVLRLAYLIWLCPYELAGDEAYYWEQARHLDLCYDEKGPALAWMIAPCLMAFGDVEWSVRLPVWLSFGIAAWGVGRLAMSVSRGDGRAGLFAVICFLLIPAFLANGQICTQDGPLVVLWVALTGAGLRLVRRWRRGESTWPDWLVLWALMGVGCLLKQSILLFVLTLAAYWVIERRSLPLRRSFLLQQLVGLALFTLLISPMIVWNYRHGWPMLAHTAGHLGAGGDQAGRVGKGNALVWVGALVGGVVGSMGPPALILMLWASSLAAHRRHSDRDQWRDRLWLMCAAWPPLAFFLALSLTKPVLPTWPLPSMVPLVALLAEVAFTEFGWGRSQSTTTAGGPGDGRFRAAWNALIIYGLGGWLILSFPNALAALPVAGPWFQRAVLKRISGHRAEALALRAALDSVSTPDALPPHIVARHYQNASLFAFYLPGHPPVSAAGSYLGHRPSSFDQWPDTTLDNPDLIGRSLLLEGKSDTKWDQALRFDRIEPIVEDKFYFATNYRGPLPRSGRSGPAGLDNGDE